MQYTQLGKTAVKVSRICLGTMTFGPILGDNEAKSIINRALELGINFFDTANIYGGGRTEEILGSAIGDRRGEVVLATKAFWTTRSGISPGLSRGLLTRELDDSLRRLKTDYIDLFYAHRWDSAVSADDVLRTFNQLVGSGKVHHIGVSTIHVWELAKSLWTADRLGVEPFQVVQPLYNLLYREEERELLPLCADQGLAVVPWAPLAQGVLTGRYARDRAPDSQRAKNQDLNHWFLREQDFPIIERVVDVAANRSVSPAQIALAWVLSRNVVTAPIVGVSKQEHLEEAVAATEIHLSREETDYLEALYQPRALVGHYGGAPAAGDLPDD